MADPVCGKSSKKKQSADMGLDPQDVEADKPKLIKMQENLSQ